METNFNQLAEWDVRFVRRKFQLITSYQLPWATKYLIKIPQKIIQFPRISKKNIVSTTYDILHTNITNCQEIITDSSGSPVSVTFWWSQISRCFSQPAAIYIDISGSKTAAQNFSVDTPKKINISPENQWLEDVFPIDIVIIVPFSRDIR